ncbi:MAG: tRNA pseudouridine(38-40) synthase TruA [Chloroflexota bacterium]|nr:tRNA pseudouridine(38-40) synthase TruA [Chloroflexota bacterium]
MQRKQRGDGPDNRTYRPNSTSRPTARGRESGEPSSRGALALVLQYDGSGFAGSQFQAGARTVQGELEAAFNDLFHEPVKTVFAGRTDRGVHAVGQVVSCRDPRPMWGIEAVGKALNARLADDLAVGAIERRSGRFHARYDASWREYRYRIWNGTPQPLARHQVWQRVEPLDVGEMASAAARLLGQHDLAALASGGAGVPWSDWRDRPRSTVRTVLRCHCRTVQPWWGPGNQVGQLLELRIVADGFLPRLVRNVAALLVEVGRGAQPIGWVDEVLASRDRRAGGGAAPPHGLTLWKVGYGGEAPDPDPVDDKAA